MSNAATGSGGANISTFFSDFDFKMTWRGPIVEEIRAIREAYSAKFNYDVEAIFADIKQRERASRRKLVSFRPKRIQNNGFATDVIMPWKVRDIMRLLHQDGWRVVRQAGSHRHLQHASKPGTVTVAGRPGEDLLPRQRQRS